MLPNLDSINLGPERTGHLMQKMTDTFGTNICEFYWLSVKTHTATHITRTQLMAAAGTGLR